MKLLTFLIFNLLFTNTIYSQRNSIVCGTFKADQKIKIKIFEPVNEYFNSAFYSNSNDNNYIINSSDSFYYKIKNPAPATLMVYITTDDDIFITKSILALFQKDSIHLSMNLINENQESILYSGSNALGHKLFNDINYNPVFKFQDIIDRLNNLKNNKNNFIQDIDKYVFRLVNRFDTLLFKSQITKEFRDFNKTALTQLLYGFVIRKFLFNYKQREVFTKEERDSIIFNFYTKQPVSDMYAKSTMDSYFYLKDYQLFNIYRRFNLQSVEPLFVKREHLINKKKYVIDNECSQFLYIDDVQVREELWAIFMLVLMPMVEVGSYDETIAQFREIFPESKWNKILEKQAADIRPIANIRYVLQSPEIYIDSTKGIETVEALLKEMPGNKPIFFDLWASWCAPCIKAFQYNRQLDTFLIVNNIERLYVSLDYQGSEQKWKSAIDKYALGGYHIMAKNPLIEDIKRICGIEKTSGIMIPRYMLITKDKSIILNNAMTPANINILKDQITKYLLH